jgi:cytochrome P450
MADDTLTDQCPEWLSTLNIWTDADLHADPYPRYAELRGCPVGRSEELGGYWVLARHNDVLAVLQDAESFSNEVLFVPPTKDPSGRRIPIELDPPEHGPYKALLGRWFSPQRVREWEPSIRRHVRALLETTAGVDEVEFVSSFAVPFPFLVMGDVFGLAPEQVDILQQWDAQGMRKGTSDLEARKAASASTRVKLLEFFREIAVDRRARSGNEGAGMVDLLVSDGEALPDDVIANICVTMWNASLHTTSNTLANSIVHLASRPELRDRLVEHPEDVGEAVEELMRYESIVAQGRLVVRAVTVGGRQFLPGDHVVTLTGSAGRDESVHPAADTIDIDRPDKKHLMFGAGLHRCIGAHIARMELRVALEEIHAAWPTYHLDSSRPPRRHTGLERGTDELWLRLR